MQLQPEEVDLFNASVSWVSEGGMYKASLEGRNITDVSYVANGVQLASPTAPSITGYIGEPRVWMLRVGVTFSRTIPKGSPPPSKRSRAEAAGGGPSSTGVTEWRHAVV